MWVSWVIVTPLGLDHILFSLLVAPVEDGAVTLRCKCHECDTVHTRLELVAPASDSRTFIQPLLSVNRRLVKGNDAVDVAERCSSLPNHFVEKHSCPGGDTGSKVGIDVVSSHPLFFEVLISALEQVPVTFSKDQAISIDTRRLDCL
jgi:hypothetical protein